MATVPCRGRLWKTILHKEANLDETTQVDVIFELFE